MAKKSVKKTKRRESIVLKDFIDNAVVKNNMVFEIKDKIVKKIGYCQDDVRYPAVTMIKFKNVTFTDETTMFFPKGPVIIFDDCDFKNTLQVTGDDITFTRGVAF